jgi:hypothetical protein
LPINNSIDELVNVAKLSVQKVILSSPPKKQSAIELLPSKSISPFIGGGWAEAVCSFMGAEAFSLLLFGEAGRTEAFDLDFLLSFLFPFRTISLSLSKLLKIDRFLG